MISFSWVKKTTFWSKLRVRGGRIIYACAKLRQKGRFLYPRQRYKAAAGRVGKERNHTSSASSGPVGRPSCGSAGTAASTTARSCGAALANLQNEVPPLHHTTRLDLLCGYWYQHGGNTMTLMDMTLYDILSAVVALESKYIDLRIRLLYAAVLRHRTDLGPPRAGEDVALPRPGVDVKVIQTPSVHSIRRIANEIY
jgi:hypothetical protein